MQSCTIKLNIKVSFDLKMSYQGNLVAAIACPPASFVITPLAPAESSSPQGRDVKEVPASSCPAPEDSCLVFKSAR